MALTWSDAQAIAERLYEAEPDLDPTTLRLSELLDRVLALEEFTGDVKESNEARLEAILTAWLDER